MLQNAWPTIEESRRRQIVRALVDLAEDNIEVDFRTVFFLFLSDEDEEVRAAAIEGLWEDESKDLLDRLLETLKQDRSIKVRATAAIGLGRFAYLAELDELGDNWGERLKSALLATIQNPNEPSEVRRRAVEAIGYFGGDEEVTEIIESAYRDPDELMRTSAIFAMGRNLDARWVENITKELHSASAEMRYEAARASGELGRKEVLPDLVPLVADDDVEVRLAAIWALGQIGGRKAHQVLTQCARVDDEVIREAAEEALDELQFSADPLGWSYQLRSGD
ncbi:MAG: HEAT repeat domain-containing protein [Chloroflexi bacterium]|nr:HEAT repeat domain-containing protein [Chloroflexota bacterium]